MAMGRATPAAPESQPGLFVLWIGILAPPVLWAIRLSGSYLLVPVVCRTGWIGVLHGLTAATLIGTLVAGALAYRAWRGAAPAEPVRGGRVRFMGLIGVLSAAFFFAVIVAEGLANFLVDPCLSAGALL